MTEFPDDHAMGANNPPPDANPLAIRLEADHKALLDEASDIELEALRLPAQVDTDEDAELVTNYVAKAKALARRVDKTRVEEKEPFLTSGRTVDGFFQEIASPITARTTALEAKLNAFQRAKREREQAERREEERRQREESERLRREQAEKDRIAREAEEERQRQAAAIRTAADADERAEAERKMREADQVAIAARTEAKAAGKEAAQTERRAETLDRAVTTGAGLGRVSTEGASVARTTFWNHRVDDLEALRASMGPLGAYFSGDAIGQAINGFKRDAISKEVIASVSLPGVAFFEDSRSSVRATAKKPG